MVNDNSNGVPATMLVGPTGGYNNAGIGGEGGSWWFIVLFVLLLLIGNFNGGYGGNRGGYAGGPVVVDNGGNAVQAGFDQAAIMNGISGIQAGVNGLGMQICNGFGQAEIANNARQMADMNQMFGLQTATMQGFNAVGAGISDLKYTVVKENCEDRNTSTQNTRDIIEAINNRAQGIENKLCQLELDGYKNQLADERRESANLRNQLNMAQIQNGMNNEVDALYNRLNNCPVPTVPVYGRQPIFTCNNNGAGGGCGCNGTFAN